MTKRKREPGEDVSQFLLEMQTLKQGVYEKGGKELMGKVVLNLSEDSNLTISDLRKLSYGKPSFPTAKWDDVAPLLGLKEDLSLGQMDKMNLPLALLPPSFHRELMKNASRWMDVYQEPGSQKKEEARVRLFEAVRLHSFHSVRL